MKNLKEATETENATFHLAARCLKHLCYCVPLFERDFPRNGVELLAAELTGDSGALPGERIIKIVRDF
jgi:hypothetical protein